MNDARPSLTRRLVSLPAEIVVGLFIVLDSIVRPLFGPVVRFLSGLRLMRKAEEAVAAWPPYVILVSLGVPFAIAELTKVYAVILMAEDHFRLGMSLFIGAYVVSILVCERIFHAGKAQLLTIPWFAVLFGWVIAIKDHLLDWFKTTRVWALAEATRQRVRHTWRRVRVRARYAFGMRSRSTQRGVLEQR